MVTPRRVVRALRRTIRRPADIPFAVRVGWFLCSAPSSLERRDLTAFLHRLRRRRRPRAHDVAADYERIARLRTPWLRLPGLRARNTCYLRALTLYRFLDARDASVKLHLGVEERVDRNERLHGHAWVTVDGIVLEEGPATISRPVREVSLDGRPR